MSIDRLRESVLSFAAETIALPFHLLDSEGWGWEEYPGLRMVQLHTALSLRQLALDLRDARAAAGAPVTRAQNALLDHQRAFRDFEALLLDLPDELADVAPAPEEWTLRTIVVHVHHVERYFYASIRNALAGVELHEPTAEEAAAWVGEEVHIRADLSLAETVADYRRMHEQIVAWMAQLGDAGLEVPSAIWEPAPRPILFRILRWASHVREHTNQVEKTLRWLERAPEEGKMLVRQTWAALAEVEGTALGAAEICAPLCAQARDVLEAKYASARDALQQIKAYVAAVESGDAEKVRALLAANGNLAFTPLEGGMSAILYSHYRGRSEVVEAILAVNKWPSLFESAATGNLERAREYLEALPDRVNNYSRDGYTALQLASFFSNEEIVRLLLARGADPLAVAHNEMRIQPIHAAVAARNKTIVEALIAAGADVNALQQGDFTPLMAAEQNGDEEIVALLVAAGARAPSTPAPDSAPSSR